MKELPTTLILEHIPNEVYTALNEYCFDKYGKCAESYCLNITMSEIEWEE